MSREKVTVEERIEAAKACTEGKISQREAARRLGLHKSTVEEWVRRYKAGGVLAFKEQEHNTVYTEEMKVRAVREYLDGKGSLKEISAKYGMRSTCQLRDWIKVLTNFPVMTELSDYSNPFYGKDRYDHALRVLSAAPADFSAEDALKLLRETAQSGQWGTRVSFVWSRNQNAVFYFLGGDCAHIEKHVFSL